MKAWAFLLSLLIIALICADIFTLMMINGYATMGWIISSSLSFISGLLLGYIDEKKQRGKWDKKKL